MPNQNLINSAKKCVKECMGIRPGENVLIITDGKKLDIAEALRQAAMEIDANVSVILLPDPSKRKDKPLTKLDEMLTSALEASDVVLTPFTEITGELRPFRLSFHEMVREKKPFRLGHMIGIEKESLIDGGLTANYVEIEELTDLLAEILSKAGKITIISGNGKYKLEADLGGWEEIASSDCGILKRKGSFGNLPAGEAYIAPTKYFFSIKGEVSIDLFADSVGLLVTPIILKIVNGSVVEIKGGREAKKFEEMLKKAEKEADEHKIPRDNVWKVAEIGIGTNPKAKVGRVAIETEKLKGTAHIALGDNSFMGGLIKAPIHYDLIINRPTIEIDGKRIMDTGKIDSIVTLRAEFEAIFHKFDAAEIKNEFFVRRVKNNVEIIDGHLYKKWMDSENREHETKVGDNDTAGFAARIMGNIMGEIKITTLAQKLKEPVDDVKKVLMVLEDYRLVSIQREDMFTLMKEIKSEITTNFEKMGHDLTKIKAIDEQTEFFIECTSEDLKKLNENINDLNIEEVLILIRNINGKIDQLDKNKVRGRISIQSAPPFIVFAAEVDAREVFDIIKVGLNKLKERFLKRK
jgi:leucyl aminopeptidase (aminopeptidase T)